MIILFFKVAIRNLLNKRNYTLLNIGGLAIGITCCLLIFNYVSYERSFDQFQKHSKQIVRVQLDDYQNGRLAIKEASNYAALANAMQHDFAEIEKTCRLRKATLLLSNEESNRRFKESRIYYADTSFLSMFQVELIAGDARTAMTGPDKMVISQDMAMKYFGSLNVIGKVLTWRSGGNTTLFNVSGVFKNYPSNSHLIFTAVATYASYVKQNFWEGQTGNPAEDSWYWTDFYTYVQLKEGIDWHRLQEKMPAFAEKHVNTLPDYVSNHDRSVFQLYPLQSIHLYSGYSEEAEPNGDGQSVSFLFMIGFFIIAIAWINYTNMATARSLERAREVGVRKVLGALRKNLIGQFMIESFLLNLLSLLVALVLTYLLSSSFNRLSGRDIHTTFSLPLNYWVGFLGLFLAGTFLSGIYPAFVLSNYNPVTVLKGLFKNSSQGQVLRKTLIIGQFATSIILIAGTIIVYRQVDFMRKQQLGVNISQTLVLNGAGSLNDSLYNSRYQPFRNDLLKMPQIKSFTASTSVMGQEILWSTNWKKAEGSNQGAVNLFQIAADEAFIPDYGMKILAGRNFSREFPTDKKTVLLNESAIRALGFSSAEKALNQVLISANGDTMRVNGVLADFHHEGLQKAITPIVFFFRQAARSNYSIKIDANGATEAIAGIKKTWAQYFPDDPFQYFFLDEFFNQQYLANQRFGQIFGLFSCLAMIIACIGLLALSAFNVIQRTKEIGIRKVLGASMQNLIFILSKDFLILVALAFVIAIPVIWFSMDSWLNSFAYRIHISWWVYAVAGMIAFFIAMATVGFQAVKAAMGNPVNSLRAE